MFPTPKPSLAPNTYAYDSSPLVKPTGFREYDARWLLEKEINLMGVQALGMGLGTLIREMGVKPEIVTGHDFRSYSASMKLALISGSAGGGLQGARHRARHHADGLFRPVRARRALRRHGHRLAQRQWLDRREDGRQPAADLRPRRDDAAEGDRARRQVRSQGRRLLRFVENFPERYIADLTKRPKLKRKLKVVAACGNGTAGAFAQRILEAIGCEVVPLDTELDYTFPKYNPNPEDMEMLHAIRDAVLEHKADVGLGFDGDGDRCGVVDDAGEEIFADKVGVMLARYMSSLHPGATFVVDVKSTGLYATDPVLQKNGVKADYWKTGHSYMKRRTHELSALAGFEKSGHYFFNKPFGRGYDDGFVSALAICDMLDRSPGKTMSQLKDALPKTWGSPTMSPHCDDEKKYGVVDAVVKHFEAAKAKGEKFAGQPIRDLVTVNGVRVTVEDGTWGLVRASSNKPELVVVVESPASEARMRDMFKAVDGVLRTHPEVGEYNQTI